MSKKIFILHVCYINLIFFFLSFFFLRLLYFPLGSVDRHAPRIIGKNAWNLNNNAMMLTTQTYFTPPKTNPPPLSCKIHPPHLSHTPLTAHSALTHIIYNSHSACSYPTLSPDSLIFLECCTLILPLSIHLLPLNLHTRSFPSHTLSPTQHTYYPPGISHIFL